MCRRFHIEFNMKIMTILNLMLKMWVSMLNSAKQSCLLDVAYFEGSKIGRLERSSAGLHECSIALALNFKLQLELRFLYLNIICI